MIVFLEGVDGGGKTELMKKLLKTFPGSTEIEWPGRQESPEGFMATAMKFYEEHKDKFDAPELYFMDRCGIGEFFYGPLQPGRKLVKASEYAKFFKPWLARHLTIVCLNPDAHKLAMERGEDGIAKDPEIHKMVFAGYALAAQTGLISNIIYNWKEPKAFETVIGAILAQRLAEVMHP
jgi:hypothetical protein